MSVLHILIFVLFFLHVFTLKHDHPVIETSLGVVKGHYKSSHEGRTFAAFEGIPYAKPPLGAMRFKEPEMADAWTGIWDATTEYVCIQLNSKNFEVIGNEDCLYLNVYVPKKIIVPNENLDVVVYIHGGAFMYEGPAMGGPEYLMDREIVYVTVNYRLGLIGFLSTDDEVVPGNNGMKDQVLALQWVQNHIKNFGGNPKSVTLFGLSAGGAAVHLHYFSPLSKGKKNANFSLHFCIELFHRGISQSGTALVPWAIQEAPLEKTRKLASLIGCDDMSTQELVKCLQQRSATQLVQMTKQFYGYHNYPLSPFAPVVEKESKTSFLAEHPYQLLNKGQLNDFPWITSVTTDEGIFPLLTILNKLKDIENHWNEALPHLLEYNYTVATSKKADVARRIREFYLNSEIPLHEQVDSVQKMFGDRLFNLDFEKAARLQTKVNKAPVYTYMFGYSGEKTLSTIFQLNETYGVGHGEDGFLLHYTKVFGNSIARRQLSQTDKTIKELLVDMVTSFAKNGKPKVKDIHWEPVTDSDDFHYLFIEKPNKISMNYKSEIAPTKFWDMLSIMEHENSIATRDEL